MIISKTTVSWWVVYPNPVVDFLRILQAEGDADIQLYNASGQLVLQKTIPKREDRIDLSSFGSGFYLLHHIPSDGEPGFSNIIKISGNR